MKINLSPQRRDGFLDVYRFGSTLVVNGETFDFSPMVDGDTLPATAIASEWFTGTVDKANGELTLTLVLPLPVNFSPAQAFPEPLLNVAEGLVSLPHPLPLLSEDLSTEQPGESEA